MGSDNPQPARGFAVAVVVVVILSVGTLPMTVVSAGTAPSLGAGEGSANLNSFASATRSIESTKVPPGGTTTVTLQIEIQEEVGKISIIEEFSLPRFQSVNDVTVEYEGGSGTTAFTQAQPDSVSVGVEDVEVGTTIVVTYDVTVVEERATYAITGDVGITGETVSVSGDSEINVRTDENGDNSPGGTPSGLLPDETPEANISTADCTGISSPPGDSDRETTMVEDVPAEEVTFQFKDQHSFGGYVLIDELNIPHRGSITLTDAKGNELGSTMTLPRGQYANVPIALDEPLGSGTHEVTATVVNEDVTDAKQTATATIDIDTRDSRPLNITVSAQGRVESTDDIEINVSSTRATNSNGEEDASDSEAEDTNGPTPTSYKVEITAEPADPTMGEEVQFSSNITANLDEDLGDQGAIDYSWEFESVPGNQGDQADQEEQGESRYTYPVSPEEDLDAEPCDLYYIWIVHHDSGTAVPTGPLMIVEPGENDTDTSGADSDADAGEREETSTDVGAPGFGVGMAILALVLTVIFGRLRSGNGS